MPAVQNENLGAIFVKALRGQELRVPDLLPYFAQWPAPDKNPNYDRLALFVNQLITTMDPPERREKHMDQDLPLFIAYWFPHVDWETLKTLSMYIIWLFLWDDAVDTGEYDLADNFVRAEKYRADTIHIFEKFIGDGSHALPQDVEICSINGVIEPFSKRLKETFTQAQCDIFLSRVTEFIESCGREQKMRMEGYVPSYDEYIALRLDTTAVYSICALAELAIGEAIPQEWHAKDSIVPVVWDETNMGVIILNDPLSLRKELKTDCVINLITSLMDRDTDVQRAMNRTMQMLDESIRKMDTTTAKFAQTIAHDKALLDRFQRYCDACRTMVIGTLHFTLKSNRYRIQDKLNPDGSLTIPL